MLAGFLLAFLNKVIKAKNELRDSNSQLQMCINNLKVYKCALKDNLLSYNHKAEVKKNPKNRPSWYNWLN